ncbi:ClbS/DfsB family four-helix bundle protein [Orbus sasakiae]|uniref:ClbS/DfsB family four-helix bundle protein n=1 Tax=Orbus sasakiae TaxID=1078475 RepID=A0ABP9N6V6_9GAMM
MARPTDKLSLQQLSEQQFQKLQTMIASLSDPQQEGTFPFDDRDKNIRDVLIHLYEWHQLFIHWLTHNLNGNLVAFLPEPYNWKTYPQMNIAFWQKHQMTPLALAKSQLIDSHHTVMQLILPLDDKHLFTKKYYPFTGTTHLASYVISATSSHYDWANKKITKYIKSLSAK